MRFYNEGSKIFCESSIVAETYENPEMAKLLAYCANEHDSLIAEIAELNTNILLEQEEKRQRFTDGVMKYNNELSAENARLKQEAKDWENKYYDSRRMYDAEIRRKQQDDEELKPKTPKPNFNPPPQKPCKKAKYEEENNKLIQENKKLREELSKLTEANQGFSEDSLIPRYSFNADCSI